MNLNSTLNNLANTPFSSWNEGKKSTELSPKKQMLHTFKFIWSDECDVENAWIQLIWRTITIAAKVINWQMISNEGEFQLQLAHEVSGIHPEYPGKAILKKHMIIQFSEQTTERGHCKIISFLQGGIFQNVGVEIPLKRICVQSQGRGQAPVCTIEYGSWPFIKQMDYAAPEAQKFWEEMDWQVNE